MGSTVPPAQPPQATQTQPAGQPQPPNPSGHLQRAKQIVEATKEAATRCDRSDFVERLSATAERLSRPEVTVLVIGEFKQGKSSLVNALIGASICPVDDDVATAVPTLLRYSEQPEATITCSGIENPEESVIYRIDVSQIGAYVAAGRTADTDQRIHLVDAGLPREILRAGLRLIDTPGVGGLESAHGKATLNVMAMADAVIFVSDSSQELTESELSFLRLARQRCSTVVAVLPKIDIYPQWKKIRDRNALHLSNAGLDVQICPVSSSLVSLSVQLHDEQLRAESGFPELLRQITDEILGKSEQIHIRAAMADVRSVAEQLMETEHTKRELLVDPATREGLVTRATEAQARATAMREAASRWQMVLNDGIADLNADVDHDLKSRTRALIAEVEALIDEHDPIDIADELLPMIEERLLADIGENYQLLRDRSVELSKQVLEVFDAEAQYQDFEVATPDDVLAERRQLEIEFMESPSYRQSLLTGMRGSYGGVLMFGMVGSVIGLATFGPVSLLAGGLMGRKAAKEERDRIVTMRRQQAKMGIKKYIDDVVFVVAKHSRDSLRQVQRQLRDTNIARAQELSTTANEQLKAARSELASTEQDREAKLKVLDASIDQLNRISTAVGELVA